MKRVQRQASEAELRDAAGGSEALYEALASFEERYGGVHHDPKRANIELGIGSLIEREIEVQRLDEPPLVLVGTEEYADVWLDARGWVWLSGPDREHGEFATSVEKYFARHAHDGDKRPKGAYVIAIPPMGDAICKALGLTRDEKVSDATFLRASSEAATLELALRGTAFRRGSGRLVVKDFTTLVAALRSLAAIDGMRLSICSGNPKVKAKSIDRAKGPTARAAEAELAKGATLRIPAVDEHGAVFVTDDDTSVRYIELDGDDGALRVVANILAERGEWIDYFLPWPEREEP